MYIFTVNKPYNLEIGTPSIENNIYNFYGGFECYYGIYPKYNSKYQIYVSSKKNIFENINKQFNKKPRNIYG